jgi:hypothetical protein
MNFAISIPSFGRVNQLGEKTLRFLENNNIDKSIIHIFVDEQEYDLYNEKYGNDYKIIKHNAKGVGNMRNHLHRYWREFTLENYVINIDDDIEELMDWDIPMRNFKDFVEEMFSECENRNLKFWGVSPYHNTFYMKKNITESLKLIVGAFNGEIIDREKREVLATGDEFEDVERCCEYFLRDGGIMRNNGVSIKTKYYNPVGGIIKSLGSKDERTRMSEIRAKEVGAKYPNMITVKKKCGWTYHWDCKLNWRFKNK